MLAAGQAPPEKLRKGERDSAYLADFQHVERLPKRQVRNRVRRHHGPPLQHVRTPAARRLRLYPVNRALDLFPHDDLPVRAEGLLREHTREKAAALGVLARVGHGEDAGLAAVGAGGLLVPGGLEEAAADAVDGGEALGGGDGDLGRGDAHDGAVAGVQGVDVVHAAAGEDVVFERVVRDEGVARAGDVADWRVEEGVD